jgi:hypothetical protein
MGFGRGNPKSEAERIPPPQPLASADVRMLVTMKPIARGLGLFFTCLLLGAAFLPGDSGAAEEKAKPQDGKPEDGKPEDGKPEKKADSEKKKKDDKPSAKEAARKNAIRGLASKIRKLAKNPRPEKKKPALLKHLEALAVLGGKEAGKAAMGAIPHPDKEVRDAAFDIIEREHDKSHLKPLIVILEHKDYRRDADAKRRVVHALSVLALPKAIEPLADLIRFDEDAEVVAEAADALASFASVKVELRKPAVRRLVDLYESTWTLKESVRQGHRDKILKKQATARYKVYGKSLRFALQALSGVQLSRPAEWRRWWNSNKKRAKWGRHSVMPKNRKNG